MTKKLILDSAGAGKTYRIVDESIQQINNGDKILAVTYTENNQKEILRKFKKLGGQNRDKFHVKGLFTFLLDDLIRPYQNCIFQGRIETINFNTCNPHLRKRKWISGREEMKDGSYNPRHYLTNSGKKAHTIFLSKLATKVIKESKGKPIARLEEIYDHVYFDEVQDLVGWDYDVLNAIAKSKELSITCVGDFRQTIYETSQAPKQPKTKQQKLDRFKKMKFDYVPMSISRRSIQSICDLADKIHANEGYEQTLSLVNKVPEEYREHTGIFGVKESEALKYIKKYNPTLLRHSVASGKQFNQISAQKMNFGKSKGSGFDRVLVLPTGNYVEYLTGNTKIFDKGKTDEPKNKLYIAMTRSRYSLGFIIKDELINKCNLRIWE